MGRLDSVLNNFTNHVTSGLSDFIFAAYEASERLEGPLPPLVLLPEIELPEPLRQGDFAVRIRALRDKFVEILGKGSTPSTGQITGLVVEIDFAPDPDRLERRLQELAVHSVYYGHDPVYTCTVSMRSSSGAERKVQVEDR